MALFVPSSYEMHENGGRDIEVEAVVSSRDGLISASNQGHIQHWNFESRRVRRDVQLRERGTENVTFSEDGKRLLTLGARWLVYSLLLLGRTNRESDP
jgi:hypothetical protein